MSACPACTHPAETQANFCSRCGFRFGAYPLAPPKGDRRVVTVLFADVSGFTALSEHLDPELVTDIVNQCFRSLTHPIYRYGGVVDKYIGDAIMAIFGAPVAHEDDPVRAVNAAWAMQLAAERFADDLEQQVGMRIRLRIGLNTGLVVAGAVGGDQKRDYTVMGDAVNLAQRMEANAQPGRVLVAHETYRLTAPAFSYRALASIRVKGRHEPVQVYELAGPHDPRSVRMLPSRMVGRDHELATLMEGWIAAQAGTPHWITLLGDAGIGKTHLVDEFQRRVGEGAEILTARGVSYHQDRAYDLVRQLLESWLRLPAEAGRDAVHQAIATKLAGLKWAEQEDAGLIALMVGHAGASAPLPGASEQLRFEAALTTSMRAMLASARLVPTMVIVEDLHWADSKSHEWLARLAQALTADPAPLLVLAQSRHGVSLPEESAPPGLVTRSLSLMPLPYEEARQLAEALLDGNVGSPPDVDKAIARAEGNPMVLRELIRSYQDGALPEASLSLKALVSSRLDRLKVLERELIELAAVIGRVFDPAMVTRLAGLPDAQPIMLALAGRDLIRPAYPEGFAFCQAIVHEVTYQGILHSKRRELHLDVGNLLEASLGNDEAHAATLAYHFQRAGAGDRALPYLHQAALLANRSYSNEEAQGYLHQALGLLDDNQQLDRDGLRTTLLSLLATITATLGDYPEAQRHLSSALQLADRPLPRADLLRSLGGIHERQGAYDAALERYEEALALLPDEYPCLRAGLLSDRAWLALRRGAPESAAADCRAALALLNGAGPLAASEQARAESILGIEAYRGNRWSEAATHHRVALQLRERTGDLAGTAASLNNLAMVEVETGVWKECEAHYFRSLALYRRIGDLGHQATILNNLGDLAVRRGDLDLAQRHHRAALKLRRDLADRFGIAASLCALGDTQRLQGEHGEARSLLSQGIAGLEAIGEHELLAEAYEAMGRLALATGEHDEAEGWLAKGAHEAARCEDRLRLSAIARAQCDLALARHQPEWARRAFDEAERYLAGLGAPLERARLQSLAARLLHLEGKVTLATLAAQRANQQYQALGIVGEPLPRMPRHGESGAASSG